MYDTSLTPRLQNNKCVPKANEFMAEVWCEQVIRCSRYFTYYVVVALYEKPVACCLNFT